MSRSPVKWVALVAVPSIILSAATISLTSASAGDILDESPPPGAGLGRYGRTGPIVRSMLPAGIAAWVSDEALAVAASRELAEARQSWDSKIDFVSQIDYQLQFRSQTDYLSANLSHLRRVLLGKPNNIGIQSLGLYLTDGEASEFRRRLAVGDLIPDIVAAIGEPDPRNLPEGQEPSSSENYGGVWQDHKHGGAIVVASVDPSKIDRDRLLDVVGDNEELRIVDVEHSWAEVNSYRDRLLHQLASNGVNADVVINSTSVGRKLEVITPRPRMARRIVAEVVPDELVTITEGAVATPMGSPQSVHSANAQQPGLLIEFDPGGYCTWGANGHTSSYNYLVTAGHCNPDPYANFSGWTAQVEADQANSFRLTPSGSAFLWSRDGNGLDIKRLSSPHADSNGYHGGADWALHIRNRASHNSWEINADYVCASLGASNVYRCGEVLEENYTTSSALSECPGSRWVRLRIPSTGGDSGSGIVGHVYPVEGGTSIDAILACGTNIIGAGSFSFGNTAYDVQTQGDFDFNCASILRTDRAATDWASCPVIDR